MKLEWWIDLVCHRIVLGLDVEFATVKVKESHDRVAGSRICLELMCYCGIHNDASFYHICCVVEADIAFSNLVYSFVHSFDNSSFICQGSTFYVGSEHSIEIGNRKFDFIYFCEFSVGDDHLYRKENICLSFTTVLP